MAALGRLEVEVAEKRYAAPEAASARLALQDLKLEVPEGQFLCVLGPSGCGKTTLLNIIAGLDRDFRGAVTWPEGEAARIGYVFQEPRLLPWLTVKQNIELVLADHEVDRDFVAHLLEIAGLEEFRDVHPQRLSLGLARRAALVRAFAIGPDLLLMDEPFVSLDQPTAERLRRLLLKIWGESPTTVVFVTHNLGEALELADRIVLLSPSPGRIVGDVKLPLPREARREPAAMERLRNEVLQAHPALFGTGD